MACGRIIILVSLSLALAWSTFLKAGVEACDWGVTLVMVGAASCAWWIGTGRPHRAPPLTPWLKTMIVLVPCYLAFQLVPLPVPILQILSPARARLVTALAPVVPGISWAPLTVMPAATLYGLIAILCYTATFLLVRELAWQWMTSPWMLALPVLAVAAVEAGIGLIQVATGLNQATGTYRNHDHYSALLEMALPFSILYGLTILRTRRRRFNSPAGPAIQACLLWTVAVLLLVAIIYSLSRGGFIVTVCVLLFLAAFTLGPRFRSSGWGWWSFAGISAAVIFVLILCTPDPLLARFAVLSGTGTAQTDPRIFVWHDTLPLIREYLWLGCGLGGFEPGFMRHQTALANFLIGWAHNDYLQFLAELGLVGVLLITVFAAGILRQIFRGIAKLEDENRRLLVIACAGAFAAMLLHSLVDFNMYVPADAMTLAWIAGIGSINGLD